ncbi:NIF3 1 [Cellvibrio japonicus]|uniref:NGG1p interacting factor NIF3 n=1 Tax=Cellvibrio japonicus (strain Ueda107) TaxID=498211 RepID=B3PBA1_CELJU|nr:NIF3 1 [Cellvibrio japonicus]ACE85156.1 hypothetical protein CJA_1073 [Cellvibrio japonicus Ueda107]QEI11686.1 NGG1p interacting factor NIF3 [Cellvibrio japonicus]QEI15260.1 NGG1p interacting factor NIF3 [Cellvibrio japonicus]QEI18840.1 NGG1p interacting factor NIF3 [Cellvibrio japonicus]
MYKLVFFVPETHLDAVKAAVFAAGAGRIGKYAECCWQVPGQGQFRPLPGSQPFLGCENQLEQIPEFRVEMVCEDACIRAAVIALREAHPYEEPAFDVWRLEDLF